LKSGNIKVRADFYFDLNFYLDMIAKRTKTTKEKLAFENLRKVLNEVNLKDKIGLDYSKEITKILNDTNRLDKDTLETLIKDTDDIIKKAKEQGKDLSKEELTKEIAKTINNKFDLVYKASRVNAIGRTVATYTSENTKRVIADKYNFKLMWISQRDSKVRMSHRKADGQKQNDKGMFSVGGYETPHPAGSGLPASEAVNCRCVTRGIRN
jgi:ribosome-binding protein aMBF1 (putative translation factor)